MEPEPEAPTGAVHAAVPDNADPVVTSSPGGPVEQLREAADESDAPCIRCLEVGHVCHILHAPYVIACPGEVCATCDYLHARLVDRSREAKAWEEGARAQHETSDALADDPAYNPYRKEQK